MAKVPVVTVAAVSAQRHGSSGQAREWRGEGGRSQSRTLVRAMYRLSLCRIEGGEGQPPRRVAVRHAEPAIL